MPPSAPETDPRDAQPAKDLAPPAIGASSARAAFAACVSAFCEAAASASSGTASAASAGPCITAASRERTRPSANWAGDAALSVLLLLLLLEWLYPLRRLSELTEIYNIAPFAVTFAAFMLLDTFRPPGSVAWSAKALWIVAITAWIHNGQTMPSPSWWLQWGRELAADAAEGLQGNLASWEPATRTLCFMAGWAFFVSVVQSFVLERRQLVWFLGLTLGYLAFFQTVLALDMFHAVLRCTGLGLLLQAMLQPGRALRWRGEAGSAAPSSRERVRPLPALLLTAACLAAGLLGASLHPHDMRTPDWSGYVRSLEERLLSHAWLQRHGWTSEMKGRTGYGSDDGRLGQPLQQDDSLAFTAVTPRLTYWRGEAKTFYTGQGWAAVNDPPAAFVPDQATSQRRSTAYALVRQKISIASPGLNRQLFAGGELTRVVSMESAAGKPIPNDRVWKQETTDRYSIPALTDPLVSYEVDALVLTDRTGAAADKGDRYPEDMRKRFLQLPATLPDRVRRLAEQLTANMPTPYAKAEAIERHLREHYLYSLEGTRAAGANEDFVDRFLFEQKTGYCDHFSTAMVVLLRSAGVPARWVKGFAPGETVSRTTSEGDERYVVQVHQKHAHSWVEAYVPSVGWVPFEPTPGFALLGGASADAAPAAASTDALTANNEAEKRSLAAQWAASLTDFANSALGHVRDSLFAAATAVEGWIRSAVSFLQSIAASPLFLWLLALLAGGGLLTFLSIRRSIPRARPLDLVRAPDSSRSLRRASLHRFADRLWRRLQRSYGRAAAQQTLREYANSRRCRSEAQRITLLQLAQLLETVRYADPDGPQEQVTRRMLTDAWRRLRQSRSLEP